MFRLLIESYDRIIFEIESSSILLSSVLGKIKDNNYESLS